MEDLTYNIECTVLASFLYNEKYLNEPCFNVEGKHFTNSFNILIADRINESIKKGESIELLNVKLDSWIKNKKPEYLQFWINIISALPMSMPIANEHYIELRRKSFKRTAYAK